MRYLVRRHGGTSQSAFRTVLDTDNEHQARARFTAIAATLRQGTAVLIDTVDDRTLERCSAPRLRRRW